MAIISTVVGELNLWENKDVELVESDFDATKKKITLTFLTKDSEGRKDSIDKLKIYGIKDYDETISIWTATTTRVTESHLQRLGEV